MLYDVIGDPAALRRTPRARLLRHEARLRDGRQGDIVLYYTIRYYNYTITHLYYTILYYII